MKNNKKRNKPRNVYNMDIGIALKQIRKLNASLMNLLRILCLDGHLLDSLKIN